MVSIAELINSQRPPSVTYYAPRPTISYRPPVAPYRPPVAPSSRYTPPAASQQAGGAVDWNAFSQANANYRQQTQQAEAQKPGGSLWGWGSPFGKGLGFLINNPVTRTITAPINYIQTGGRAITLGAEEAAEALPGLPDWTQNLVASIPGLGTGTIGPAPMSSHGAGGLLGQIDTSRTEADPRSNWEKVFAPGTTYGYGELLDKDNPTWFNNIAGLTGDVAFDPLTYVGGGATRLVEGATHVDEAARALNEATAALKVAQEAGDAGKIAEATARVARAEDYVGRAPELGRKMWEVPTPRNRAERANLFAELSETPAGRRFMEEMPSEAARGGVRGFQTISPEAKELLGIAEPGLRLRGFDVKIPGTGRIAEAINTGGGLIRQGLADLPGGASKFRNIRTPSGLEAPFETLTRGGEGDLLRAATVVQGANVGRVGTGGQLARGNRVISHGIKEFFKGKSDDAVRTMVSQAETVAEPNGINKILARILEQYRTVTGRVMDKEFLKNPDTYFPHIMDPKWRRTVAKMAKKGDKSAADFLRHMDTHFDELLEDPAFYADNLMGESGYLEKSRKYGPNPETGEPQTFDIGGVEVTFSEDNVDHVNEQLRKAFPNYKGDFYDTNPKRVLEAYNKSLSRQAGRDVAARRAVDVGNPLWAELGGDIDATRLAMNEALAQQRGAGLLSTAQGRYVPAGQVEPAKRMTAREVMAKYQPADIDLTEVVGMTGSEADFWAKQATVGRTGYTGPISGTIDPIVVSEEVGSLGKPQISNGHRRLAALAAADPDAEIPVLFVRNVGDQPVRTKTTLPDIPERPVPLGSPEDKARRAQIEAIETAIETAPTGKNAAIATAELAATPQPPARIGGIDPADYFATTGSEEATQAYVNQAKRARTYSNAAAKELGDSERKLRSGVYDLKEMIIQPLKTSISEMGQEIRTLNSKIRTWGKTLKDLPPLSGEVDAIKAAGTQDELTAIITKVEAEVNNAETKLKRTASSWKGRATRKQRAAEADLRKTLEDLKRLRLDAWEKARAAPQQIREEIEFREQVLNQPVRDANQALLEAEIEYAVMNPVPHNQAAVDGALEVLLDEAYRGVDPAELRGRFRSILDSATVKAEDVLAEGRADTPMQAAKRADYAEALKDVADIASRPRRRGKLSRANQQFYDVAVARRNALALELGQATARVSPYDEAVIALDNTKKLIDEATGVTPPKYTTPEEVMAALERGEPLSSAGGKGATPGDLPRLRAERNRLQRQFRPGGRFYREHQANTVIEEMAQYEKQLDEATAAAQEALKNAEFERSIKQEAVVWKNTTDARRYVTRHGEPPSQLEEMGRLSGQQRVVEPVQMPARRSDYATAQKQLVLGPEGPKEEIQAILPPRTEQEAIASLKSLEQTGGAAVMSARGQAATLGQEVAAREAALPHELDLAQARIQMEVSKAADQELGPLAERAQTFTNLATDLTDKKNLVVKRDAARAMRDSIRRNPKSTWNDLDQILDDLEAVAKANPDFTDPKLNQVESLLHTYREELSRIDEGRMRVRDLDRVVADAESGRMGKVMIATLNNNWKALHSGPLNTGDIIMDAQLHKMFTNLFEVNRQPKLLGRVFNAFTNLFKTYATLSPGFFVRNTIGGVFMNTADGVALTAQLEGAKKWQLFMQHGTDWLDQQPQRVKDAFAAAAASGAGGRFEDAGVLAKTNSKLYNIISSNPATRLGQRWGTRVEGGMRLGMALDSIDNGMGVQGALQRITRVHFDYNQVSQVDETMKRIIPFWTFMSRNLPLQIQEQWTNPRVYSYYDHLVQNFKLPDEEFTPEYWTRQGAWRTPISIAGAPLYMQPDLGFNRVQQDIKAMSDALEGNPGLLFAQTNPALGATMDFFNKRDSFYNRQYTPEDYKKMSGPIGAPIALLAKMLNQTNEAGQVSENFTNYLQSMIPPLNQALRLLPGSTGQEPTMQTQVKRARYMGLPIQLLTPEVQDSEYWRQWRAMQDEQDRLEAMAREAAS